MRRAENGNTSIQDEFTDEHVFQWYMEDLGLSPEDLKKKILDVGAGSAQFAKWAKEHGISDTIYSLESKGEELKERNKSVVAAAEEMPFADESFDIVVSHAAIPNVYIRSENIETKVYNSLREMMRVLKQGGEARLSPVLMGDAFRPDKVLFDSIEESFRKLEKECNVTIEKVRTPKFDVYDTFGSEKSLTKKAYLIVIRKPNKAITHL